MILIVKFEKCCYEAQSIFLTRVSIGIVWGAFAPFIPTSRTPARLTEISVPGMERSACQIQASHKILLCMFDKYGFQFRCKEVNCYPIVVLRQNKFYPKWQLASLNILHVEILPIQRSIGL